MGDNRVQPQDFDDKNSEKSTPWRGALEGAETRRDFLSLAAKVPLALGLTEALAGCVHHLNTVPAPPGPPQFEVAVIGSGFGGTTTALTLARRFKRRKRGEKVLILERGAWWTTPVETVQDPETRTKQFLAGQPQALGNDHQPVRQWVSADHARGLFDLLTRCVRRPGQLDGLYDIVTFRPPDGKVDPRLAVIQANGVGGGSLVYQNVTIQPPDGVLDDFPVTWAPPPGPIPASGWTPKAVRDEWYKMAREAIGFGILNACDSRDPQGQPNTHPVAPVNAGLSNIVTRSSGLDPHWLPGKKLDKKQDNSYWLNRSRVFQAAAADVLAQSPASGDTYGTVDSAINDLMPTGQQPVDGPRINYCERQGRCILGCLPGARHTLNKQLMRAMFGSPSKPPDLNGPNAMDSVLQLQARAEVVAIKPRGEQGLGYEITYRRDDDKNTLYKVTARRVILAAGAVNTTHLLLRCQAHGDLPHLSPTLGTGFSNNGDYLAFFDETKETIALSRGPMATSFAHFDVAKPSTFLTLEDAGLPRMFSFLFGRGSEFVADVSRKGMSADVIIKAALQRAWVDFKDAVDVALSALGGLLGLAKPKEVNQTLLQAEEIDARRILCVAGMGRDQANGVLSLDSRDEDAPPRLTRADQKPFNQDPIYVKIRARVDALGAAARGDASNLAFKYHHTPYVPGVFQTNVQEAASRFKERDSKAQVHHSPAPHPEMVLGSLHPLGGCRMAPSVEKGVVDEHGRVYKAEHDPKEPYYDGLYIADGSIVPTPLGVNPSLTITVLALRIVQALLEAEYKD